MKMLFPAIRLLTALVTLTTSGSLLMAQSPDRAAFVAVIDSIVEAALAADGTPGIGVAVVHGLHREMSG
jgi:hypothetical protein